MSRPALAPVEQQLRRVRRRLFVQTLLDRAAWCWGGGLFLVVAWFLVQPLLWPDAEEWVRWAAAGGAVALASVLAFVLARLAAPSRLEAALELDERFGLKERVTTSLSLDADLRASPAAEALLADANRRVAGLDVPSRFPLRLSWPAALVPVWAAALTLVAFFYDPRTGGATPAAEQNALREQIAKEANEKRDNAAKVLKATLPKDQLESEKLKELMKLLKEPLDLNDKEKVREQLQALKAADEENKQRLADAKARADKGKQLKEQLKNLDGIDPKGKREGPKDKPGKDLEDALAKGKFDKAADELEKLRKKLENDKLNPEERKKLEDQLRDLERRLQRLADMQDLKDALADKLKKGELEREEFDDLMDKLADDAADMQDLKDLAGRLGDVMKALKKGDRMKAGKLLKAIKGKLLELDPDAKELKDLEAKDAALCQACQALLLGLVERPGNGLGGGGPPGTKRPMGKDAPVVFKGARQKAEEDEKAQYKVTGFRRGGTFRKVPAREVGGAFRQAVQEAPAAIERQRVPPDAADILKGYYENLGGQK